MLATHHKILIVEDNATDADLVVRELKRNGLSFTAKVIETREAFENALEHFEPGIIISDYSLPAFDGLSAFHLKQNKCPDIPLIMVSGTIGEERAVELIKNGVTDYTLKDKLFTLTPQIKRALKEAEEHKAREAANEQLKIQYKKLREIAIMQSHQVRVPVVQILGLFNLFKFDNPEDPVNAEIFGMLKIVAEQLDKVIVDITQKTDEIKEFF